MQEEAVYILPKKKCGRKESRQVEREGMLLGYYYRCWAGGGQDTDPRTTFHHTTTTTTLTVTKARRDIGYISLTTRGLSDDYSLLSTDTNTSHLLILIISSLNIYRKYIQFDNDVTHQLHTYLFIQGKHYYGITVGESMSAYVSPQLRKLAYHQW